MSIGLLGRKVGMTRIYTEEGKSIPVTVVSVFPNRVSQIKTVENDGYSAVQLTAGAKKISRVSKPLAGHFAKASIEAGDMMAEYALNSEAINAYSLGQLLTVDDVFADVKQVDVSSTSKGKGFAGGVKRWNFKGGPATHGQKNRHRAPGSIGNTTPQRVLPGRHMAGHLGMERITYKNIKLVDIDAEKKIVMLGGGVPGPVGRTMEIYLNK